MSKENFLESIEYLNKQLYKRVISDLFIEKKNELNCKSEMEILESVLDDYEESISEIEVRTVYMSRLFLHCVNYHLNNTLLMVIMEFVVFNT